MMSTNPRRWFVLAGALLMLLGTLYGFGLIGTPVEESISGSLAANATLVAPATPAFQIWSVIYLGLFAYTIWQLLPASRDSQRADAIAIPAARDPGPLVTRCRNRTVAKVDSIGFVVRRWTQCSAG